MIFSELYSLYYKAVARIISAAIDHPVKEKEIRDIAGQNTFAEGRLVITKAITDGSWQLIAPDGTTAIRNVPTMPLTLLERRWLKALYSDPKIGLFTDEKPYFGDIEPLFTQSDICVFDKYADGDPFEDEDYIACFRLILDAIKKDCPLSVDTVNRRGGITHSVIMPKHIEYSEKDDKFRLYGISRKGSVTINLGRIVKCRPYSKPFEEAKGSKTAPKMRTVVFELTDERNALNRVLLHFAHFEKQAERLDDDRYRVTVRYDRDDETEMVIRLLSFGPMVKVTEPSRFVDLIKERLKKQQYFGY